MNGGATGTATWLRHRLPEVLLVLFGVALRAARNGTLPPPELREAFHPPLFYILAS